jgi:hypothetical protein
MTVTPSTLRQNIYKLLDQVLESGEPLLVSRKGKILEILPRDTSDKNENPLKDSILFESDIIEPVDEKWDAAS